LAPQPSDSFITTLEFHHITVALCSTYQSLQSLKSSSFGIFAQLGRRRHLPLSSCMDCGSTGTAAGIDPKILDNWQTEGAYSVASWEHLGYDQPPEWDTSQESSQCDADIADLGTFQGPLNEYRRLENRSGIPCKPNTKPRQISLTPWFSRKHDVAPDTLNYVDGVVEGTGSSTISPKTIPSSADENFHSDEAWPHFQLYNSVGMPMDASLLYPYAKPQNQTGAVIVDDVGEMPHGFPDAPVEGIMSFQQIPQSFPMIPEQWAEMQHGLPAENMPPPQDSIPLSAKAQEPKNHSLHQFQTSIRSLESRWLNSLESQLPTQMTPQTVGPRNAMGQEFQFKSENSSVSGDMSGLYECSYSATSDDAPAFADRQLSDDDSQWKTSPQEPSSREGSQPAPKTTAFMVSEVSEPMVSAGPSRSRASSNAGRGGRPAPLAMQSSATVRKRKTRNPGSSIDQSVRPLQIVQEDGQGGSIASADFVSPPRGARRKGPLSMAGRANAGLRRKNKDTCVQCRLNKRKVNH
jgi:hypothetical protein